MNLKVTLQKELFPKRELFQKIKTAQKFKIIKIKTYKIKTFIILNKENFKI